MQVLVRTFDLFFSVRQLVPLLQHVVLDIVLGRRHLVDFTSQLFNALLLVENVRLALAQHRGELALVVIDVLLW